MYRYLRTFVTVAATLAAFVPLRAQFVLSGEDPGSIKWESAEGAIYKVIYPETLDSIGGVYLRELEKYRIPLSASLGMSPGGLQWQKPEVLLHTRNTSSNGFVTWTPNRMELYTIPQWNKPDPIPWHTNLAIHEGRHLAQMQNGYRKVFKPFGYVLGEIIPSFAAAYPEKLLLEGDAVIAETALSNSGRGRSGNFLEYYMFSLDRGDRRNWMRWRYGSYYRYTPDHYAMGYLLLSAMRTKYDKPLFMADYFDYVSRRPYDPWPLRHAMRRTSGKKFRPTFSEILDYHHALWQDETLARSPFQATEILSGPSKRLLVYTNPNVLSDSLSLWVKNDIYRLPALISLDTSGKERRIKTMSSAIGRISTARDSSLYWNELRKDPRWGQVINSVICRLDLKEGRFRTLKAGRPRTLPLPKGNYFQPSVFAGDSLVIIEYAENTRSSLVLADGKSGEIYGKISLPDGMQALQTTTLAGIIYVSVLKEGGCGIWKTDGKHWTRVLEEKPATIFSLGNDGSNLIFGSDRNGVGELYRLQPETGILEQLTNTRYGGTDFALNPDGSALFPQYAVNGTRPMIVRADEIQGKEVSVTNIHSYPVADKLSRQEEELGAFDSVGETSKDTTTLRRKWNKAAHAFRFHSWAPLFVDIDNLQNISMDVIQHTASLGAVGFFQNTMSTLSGYVGYKAASYTGIQPDGSSTWYHSGHIKVTYSGLYPVIELQAHIGDGRATDMWYNEKRDTVFSRTSSRPSVQTSLDCYVPLSWKRGVWNYGLIPEFKLLYTNSRLEATPNFDIHAGVRAYAMQGIPPAGVYPRLGVGMEAKYLGKLSYMYLYGYVPGICCGQGLKLSAVYQISTTGLSPFLNAYAKVLPRGFTGGFNAYTGARLSADYAIPFNMGDWHITDMLHCTRGIVTPFADVSYLTGLNEGLYSAGASFELEFACFFWIKTPVRIGLSYSYSGASSAIELTNPHKVGVLFNIDLP